MLTRRPKAASSGGFTLIELMIYIVILSVLLAYAVPDFIDWIGNSRIRTAASNISEGVQRARLEAIKGNATEGGGAVTANTNTVVEVFADGGYRVCARNPADSDDCNGGLMLSDHQTGGNARLVVDPTVIRFNNLGRRVVPVGTQNTVINVSYAGLDADEQRELTVTVSPGGKVKVCEPDPSVAATDPRFCNTN